MKEVDVLKDILQYRTSSQVFYNRKVIDIENPEVRQLFSEMRDDELRAIMRLEQKIKRLEAKPYIISKIFPTKSR